MSRPITPRPIAMISSTFRDLEDYRQQVRDACDRAGFAPREMMEHSNAKTIDAVQSSLQMVDNATVYIGVFAHRYGDVPEGSTTSITEMEYERAVAANKLRLIFVMDDNHPVPPKMVETGDGAEKLKALKARIQQDVVTGTFKQPDDLYGCVRGALEDLKDQLKGDQPEDALEAARRLHRRTPIPAAPTPYIAHPYTLSQTRDLVGRQEELNALTDWVAKPGSPAYGDAIF